MTFTKSKYWQLIKRSYMRKNPACEKCKEQGRIVAAKDVYFISIMTDPFLMSEEHNLISVCDSCK